jgi:Fe-S-cluster containining protein
MPPVRVLSLHAAYRCGHTGACCTSNWPIPIEPDRLTAVRAAMAAGRLRTVGGGEAFIPARPSDTEPALLETRAHACVFFDADAGRRCRIHAALGHAALPLACRQFPRVSLLDPRGASVTLSHYCPTARAMLDRERPIAIVSDAAFPESGEYVGLDARESLPPLLRPGVLMDWEAWWEWERLAIDRIDRATGDLDELLADLRAVVEVVRRWTPGEDSLIARVRKAFGGAAHHGAASAPADRSDLMHAVMAAIPEDLRPATLPQGERPSAAALRGFVAAHAFANWTAYVGQGLHSWMRSLEAAVALIDAGCGIRDADLLLRHLADPYALADAWSREGVRS